MLVNIKKDLGNLGYTEYKGLIIRIIAGEKLNNSEADKVFWGRFNRAYIFTLIKHNPEYVFDVDKIGARGSWWNYELDLFIDILYKQGRYLELGKLKDYIDNDQFLVSGRVNKNILNKIERYIRAGNYLRC